MHRYLRAILPSSLRQRVRRVADRRCRFFDISKVAVTERRPRSRLLQFYSSIDNIGNYLPVLGIWRVLGSQLDTCCMHAPNIDFDFINRRYDGVIIGGAGLLHKCFEPFWERIARECSLPMVVWGVGGCFVDGDPGSSVSQETASPVLKRCDCVNFRDDTTANYYEIWDAHISPCPTIAYLQDRPSRTRSATALLYSSHEELTPKTETRALKEASRCTGRPFLLTDNIQRPRFGLHDILRSRYGQSGVVVTTRLHGAIIAYGLSIPYVAVPYDEKLRAFHRLYGNGQIANGASDVRRALLSDGLTIERQVRFDLVEEFGSKVRKWASSL